MTPSSFNFVRDASPNELNPSTAAASDTTGTQSAGPESSSKPLDAEDASNSHTAAIVCGVLFPVLFLGSLLFLGLRYRRYRRQHAPMKRLKSFDSEKLFEFDLKDRNRTSVVIINPETVAAAVARSTADLHSLDEAKTESPGWSTQRFSEGSLWSVSEMFARPDSILPAPAPTPASVPPSNRSTRYNRWSVQSLALEMESLRSVTDMFTRPQTPPNMATRPETPSDNLSHISTSVAHSESPSEIFSGRDSPWTEETVPTSMSDMVPPQPAHLRFPRGRACLAPSGVSMWTTATAGTLPSYCSTPRSQEFYMEGGSNAAPVAVFNSRIGDYVVQPVF